MANELEISCRLKYSKGDVEVDTGNKSFKVDVSGDNVISHVQQVGTSEEAITLGDVAAGGWCMAENLDATNYVEIRQGTGIADLIKLKAGEACIFRLPSDASAPYAIADTAACNVRFWIFDD